MHTSVRHYVVTQGFLRPFSRKYEDYDVSGDTPGLPQAHVWGVACAGGVAVCVVLVATVTAPSYLSFSVTGLLPLREQQGAVAPVHCCYIQDLASLFIAKAKGHLATHVVGCQTDRPQVTLLCLPRAAFLL